MSIPFKIITERLVIRCYRPSDAILVQNAIASSLENLRKWMPWAKSEPTTLESKKELVSKFESDFIQNEDYTFGIFNKSEDLLIGSTGLHTRLGKESREIGYWINSSFLNKGYATEAASAMVKAGFEFHRVKNIQIHCDSNNLISRQIPKKLGFKLIKILKEDTPTSDNNSRDTMIWDLSFKDYAQIKEDFAPIQAFDQEGKVLKIQKNGIEPD
ncbi:GNAT family N-acetyltransferase [Flagellimonas allohymeniacidonis]|uniref:N-acetyltransferase n=1 Tax=Flagellimonas allohymeniacidonis TaxID=2517819 RepID=A0A4Q8QHZ8_9FLAO|nr:GNAT family N-acetyltransferase [Allomuricauda hymeniacidonis]TAI47806.1 N-acetyltransferase [Allomuricauda hymeniacidonis]